MLLESNPGPPATTHKLCETAHSEQHDPAGDSDAYQVSRYTSADRSPTQSRTRAVVYDGIISAVLSLLGIVPILHGFWSVFGF